MVTRPDSGMVMGARDFAGRKDYVTPRTDQHSKNVAKATLQPPLYHPTPGRKPHRSTPTVRSDISVCLPTTLWEAANAEARKPQHLSFLPSTDRVGQSSAHTDTTDQWNRPPSYTQMVAPPPSTPTPVARPNDE